MVNSVSNQSPANTNNTQAAKKTFADTIPLGSKETIFEALLSFFSTPSANFPTSLLSLGPVDAKFSIVKMGAGSGFQGKDAYRISFRLSKNGQDSFLRFGYVDLGSKGAVVQMQYNNINTGNLKINKKNYAYRMTITKRIFSRLRALLQPRNRASQNNYYFLP
jgi:hypothetical protein